MKATKSSDLRVIGQAASLAVLLALGTIGGVQAAGKGKGKPTNDIVADADAVVDTAGVDCNSAVNLSDPTGLALISTACRLMENTDGYKDGFKPNGNDNCDKDPFVDEPAVKYTGRNCNYNEDTLRRDAGSVVTELGDAFEVGVAEEDLGLVDKCEKLQQAYVSIGSYRETYGELTTPESDDPNERLKLTDNAGLGEDAESIELGIATIFTNECS
jgi:hypothetical protein